MKNTIIRSISVNKQMAVMMAENRLSWSEASRIGASIMLGDLGVMDYDNSLNLYRKMQLYRNEAQKKAQEAEALLNEIKNSKVIENA